MKNNENKLTLQSFSADWKIATQYVSYDRETVTLFDVLMMRNFFRDKKTKAHFIDMNRHTYEYLSDRLSEYISVWDELFPNDVLVSELIYLPEGW